MTEAQALVRESVHVRSDEMPVAVTEVLRTVLSLPPQSVTDLRAAGGPALARALVPAVGPLASPHLANRLS